MIRELKHWIRREHLIESKEASYKEVIREIENARKKGVERVRSRLKAPREFGLGFIEEEITNPKNWMYSFFLPENDRHQKTDFFGMHRVYEGRDSKKEIHYLDLWAKTTRPLEGRKGNVNYRATIKYEINKNGN
jgi:hypothetical protein